MKDGRWGCRRRALLGTLCPLCFRASYPPLNNAHEFLSAPLHRQPLNTSRIRKPTVSDVSPLQYKARHIYNSKSRMMLKNPYAETRQLLLYTCGHWIISMTSTRSMARVWPKWIDYDDHYVFPYTSWSPLACRTARLRQTLDVAWYENDEQF